MKGVLYLFLFMAVLSIVVFIAFTGYFILQGRITFKEVICNLLDRIGLNKISKKL